MQYYPGFRKDTGGELVVPSCECGSTNVENCDGNCEADIFTWRQFLGGTTYNPYFRGEQNYDRCGKCGSTQNDYYCSFSAQPAGCISNPAQDMCNL